MAAALAIRWMTGRGMPVAVQVFFRSPGRLLRVAPVIAAGGLAVFRTGRPEALGNHDLRDRGSGGPS